MPPVSAMRDDAVSETSHNASPTTTTALKPVGFSSVAATGRAPAASQGAVAVAIEAHTPPSTVASTQADAETTAAPTASSVPAATKHSPISGLRVSLSRLFSEWALSLLIAAAVLTAWRGVWVAIDVTLLPHAPIKSANVSVGIGVGMFVVCAIAQPVLAAWARAHPALRVLWLADFLFTYSSFVCGVLLWRGLWMLWDYQAGRLVPRSLIDASAATDAIITHIGAMMVLVLLGRTRSLVAAPMTIASADSSPPIFGAALTPGFEGLMFTQRLRRPPRVEEADEWYNATGLACFLTGPTSECSNASAAQGENGATGGKERQR